jgi:opacity protein-like surface antigen
MDSKKRVGLAAAAALAAALIAAPALAAGHGGHGGGGGGRGGGGFGGGFRGGGGFAHSSFSAGHVGGFRSGGFARSSLGVGRVGGLRTGAVAFGRRPFVAHRALFPRHRFFAGRRLVGYGAYADYSCWRWVPTAYGLSRVWVCNYPYLSDY